MEEEMEKITRRSLLVFGSKTREKHPLALKNQSIAGVHVCEGLL
jgi:hypothetical protein